MRIVGSDVTSIRWCAFGTAPRYVMARILKLGILLGCDGYGCDTHAPIYTRHHILQFINYECRAGDRCGRWNSTHLYQHSLVLLARNITRRVAGKEPSLGNMAYPKKLFFILKRNF